MLYVDPFSEPGRWYRGNTHTHSTLSDGEQSVEERCRGYRQRGYDFLVVTDHRRVSDVSRYSADRFLVLPGSELHPANPYGGTLYHIVAINIGSEIEVARKHPNEVMAEVAAQGGISVLAHPYWSGHTLLDLLPLHGHFAVEVFNTTCDKSGRAFSESQWDDLLDRTVPVFGIASDDCHFLHDLYQGWVMVKSPALTPEAITDALGRGAFYSTQGPEILDFRLEAAPAGGAAPGRVTARFSPAASVVFKASPCRGKHLRARGGELLTEASYEPAEDDRYVRLEVTAPDGRKAWSQPIVFRTNA